MSTLYNLCLPVVILLMLPLHLQGAQRPGTVGTFATRSELIAQHGMAATSHPLATQIAIDIMKQGGNAVDAAIAANAALGLMEPTGNGIGGDIFAIVWDAESRQLYGLNGSGRSPESLTLDYFKEQGYDRIPSYGPLPVSVPGCVDGWFTLHDRFGELPMEEILAPAIRYAREGFPVTDIIARAWAGGLEVHGKYPNVMETYSINGHAPRKGEIFRNPYLANTLEKISQGGRDVFYEGEIARTIDTFIEKQGGFLSYEDLAAHHSEWVEPISSSYRGYDIWELPPNGQGIAALQILNILEGYDIGSVGFGSPEHIHYFVEAKKLAFEDRAKFYADPDFHDIPVAGLISKEYAAERRQLIDSNRARDTYLAGNPSLEAGETIYLTTADDAGNMVSLIQSNYRGLGSGMVPDNLGFMLQDRGELFTLEEGHFNTYSPGKRPFHTIIPAFITRDGEPYMSFGVMGGPMQPQGHAQIIVNIIDFGMNIQEAGDAPRIRHSGSSQPTGEEMTDGGIVHLEPGFSKEAVMQLKRMGHRVDYPASGGFGGYQAILWDQDNEVYFGASESRKDGTAIGY